MKLYYTPGACSLSPHIALNEAGLPHELVKVDLKAKKTEAGTDYLSVNPKGYVPALGLDDGSVLTEGPAIVQYIADLKPETGLAPKAGTRERYQLQEWLAFISTELHKQYSPLFQPALSDDTKKFFREKISGRQAWLDAQLAKKQYLMGDSFTVADGYLFTILSWAPRVGLDLAQWPNLKAYYDRLSARPKVRATMVSEGLIK